VDTQDFAALAASNGHAPARQVGIDLAVLLEELLPVVAGRLVGIVRGTEHGPFEVGAAVAVDHFARLIEDAPFAAIVGTFRPHEVIQGALVQRAIATGGSRKSRRG